jgi:DNA primase
MAKAPSDTVKYNIYAEIMIDGVVEKPDVVGALFGQSEGLLGEELELRDLQKTGRIGRIEVDIKTKSGKSTGTIIVPSSLDMVETSIIAATIETVDRVGPCNAKIKVVNVEDARSSKRKNMIERAKNILKKMMAEEIPESAEITDEVRKAVQLSEITSYKSLPAGPGIESADSVILVEGRADVLNLLKCGIRNVVAVGGTNIPKQIAELSRQKTTIAFVDGDRGGEIILKELMQIADIDFVAKAPRGKEVEDLGQKEIIMSLRRKIPTDQVKVAWKNGKAAENAVGSDTGVNFKKELEQVKGKLISRLYDKNAEMITEIEIKDLINTIAGVQPHYVVLDGIVTQRLIDAAAKSGVKTIVGVNKAADITNSRGINIITDKEAMPV